MVDDIKIKDMEFDLLSLNDVSMCLPESAVFIKEDEYQGKIFWGIYNLEGIRIAVTDNRECAFVLARQNDLEPQSAH